MRTPASTPPPRFDTRTAIIMLLAAVAGAAWAAFNLASTGGERGGEQMQPLIWVIFAGPFALCIGWIIARPREVWLAIFTCFCLYFFMPFVAQRFESLLVPMEQARATGHQLYFQAAIVMHLLSGIGVAIWRARTPRPQPAPATPPPTDMPEGATP